MNGREQDEEGRKILVYAFAGLCFVMLFLMWTGPFLPPAILGGMLGVWVYQVFRQELRKVRVLGYVHMLGFFCLVYYALLGAPWWNFQRFAGILFWSPKVLPFFQSMAKYWNTFSKVVSSPLGEITGVDALLISQYVWSSLLFAAVIPLGIRIYFRRRDKDQDPYRDEDKKEMKHGPLAKAVFSPATAFNDIFSLVFGMWLDGGRGLNPREPNWLNELFIGTVITAVLPLVTMGVRHFFWFPRNPDLRFFLDYALWLPLIGWGLGFVLGRSRYGHMLVDYLCWKNSHESHKIPPGFVIGKTFNGSSYRIEEDNLSALVSGVRHQAGRI
ncbi:hypothetical protein WDW86_10940 [Bdellovibrionota bacterium FG-2]